MAARAHPPSGLWVGVLSGALAGALTGCERPLSGGGSPPPEDRSPAVHMQVVGERFLEDGELRCALELARRCGLAGPAQVEHLQGSGDHATSAVRGPVEDLGDGRARQLELLVGPAGGWSEDPAPATCDRWQVRVGPRTLDLLLTRWPGRPLTWVVESDDLDERDLGRVAEHLRRMPVGATLAGVLDAGRLHVRRVERGQQVPLVVDLTDHLGPWVRHDVVVVFADVGGSDARRWLSHVCLDHDPPLSLGTAEQH